MEEDEEDENDFQTIKQKKTSSILRNMKPKRSLPLSLKSTRSKKKACSIKMFLEKNPSGTLIGGKDQLDFCPVCQLPFRILIGLSVEGHVQECVANYSVSSVICPNGVDCNSVVPDHFKNYSHQQLASLRSLKIPKNITSDEEIQHNELTEVESTDVHLKSSLTNNSKDTSTSSSESLDTDSSAPFCVLKNSSVNTINTTKGCEPLPMLENIMDAESTVETQSSGKENFDDINHWFNDSLEYENFEMVNSDATNFCDVLNPKFVVNFTNTETKVATVSDAATTSTVATLTVATNVTTKSQKYSIESIEEKLTCSKSPRTQKQPVQTTVQTSRKQMDIGVYFGLEPKHKVTSNVSVIQQKEVVNVQLKTQCNNGKATSQTKKCPFYKIVEGSSFAVDAFSYGHIPGISAYFLSHFHYDHYGGLKRSFSKPIYCSQFRYLDLTSQDVKVLEFSKRFVPEITANLISLKIKVAARFIHPMSLYTPTVIENIEVTLLEANHCPGAVMFIFKLPNGQTHLHTGDFRASTAMQEIPFLDRSSIHTLYLDTTYCDPSYSFPPQSETIEFCVSVAQEAMARNAKTLIVVGTYTIGKEKIFSAVANAIQCKVAVQRDKYNVLQCLESEHLKRVITQDYKEAKVHVLPMAHLIHKKLAVHLEVYSSQYSELLAFKPTGWTFNADSCGSDLRKIKPSKRSSVTIYGVPYSEHSSFNELKQFVQFTKPRKIIPTVNNGSAKRREEMKNIFNTWLRN